MHDPKGPTEHMEYGMYNGLAVGLAEHVRLRSHCRAYDMAAIALKGLEKATTNFPKERYLQEPFMLVRRRMIRACGWLY